jgi:hypothetical protein
MWLPSSGMKGDRVKANQNLTIPVRPKLSGKIHGSIISRGVKF